MLSKSLQGIVQQSQMLPKEAFCAERGRINET